MKILVCSDSHGCVSNMISAAEKERPDRMIHLGDYWRDAQRLSLAMPELPLHQVPGNCDWESHAPGEGVLELEGMRLAFCHGHQYYVKSGYDALVAWARLVEAELVLCGHTHRAYLERVRGVQVMNPGSIGSGTPTYGIILLEAGTARCRIVRLIKEDAPC